MNHKKYSVLWDEKDFHAVANRLNLAERTVKFYLNNVRQKLHCKNIVEILQHPAVAAITEQNPEKIETESFTKK